jgi:hypothetical protein
LTVGANGDPYIGNVPLTNFLIVTIVDPLATPVDVAVGVQPA